MDEMIRTTILKSSGLFSKWMKLKDANDPKQLKAELKAHKSFHECRSLLGPLTSPPDPRYVLSRIEYIKEGDHIWFVYVLPRTSLGNPKKIWRTKLSVKVAQALLNDQSRLTNSGYSPA